MLVAEGVGRQAIADGVSDVESGDALNEQIHEYVWEPVYLPYERIK